jgi:hypothetical protein
MEERMNGLVVALCLAVAATSFAFAQEKKDTGQKASVASETTKHDTRMSDDKKADSREAKSANGEPTEKQKATQARMKECAAKAGDRKGDERKKFMSECLSKA